MYRYSRETAADQWEVEALYDVCFAPGRTALASYRLRDGVQPIVALSMLARDDDGILAAAIRYWPCCVADKPVLLLGPVGVHPTRQGEGLGAYLMRDSLARAARMGWARVLLVGDAPYYGRFGFHKLSGVTMPPPINPDRVLGLALAKHAWDGVTGIAAPSQVASG
ncbi:MAG: GNAT family N-acetyltransferase [Paracoccaceae bacterium]